MVVEESRYLFDTNAEQLLAYLNQIITYEIKLLDVKQTIKNYVEIESKLAIPDESVKELKKPVFKEVKKAGKIRDRLFPSGIVLVIGFVIDGIIHSNIMTSLALFLGGGIVFEPMIKNKIVNYIAKKKYVEETEEYEENLPLMQVAFQKEQKRLKRETLGKNYCKKLIFKLELLVKEIEETLKALYSLQNIPGKYQKPEVIIAFIEYIIAGKTKSLERSEKSFGAFHLYEEDKYIGDLPKFGNPIVIENSDKPFTYDNSSRTYQAHLFLTSDLENTEDLDSWNEIILGELDNCQKLKKTMIKNVSTDQTF